MPSSTPFTAAITLLIVILMFATGVAVARGRGRYQIKAPAITGHPDFERLFRVQMNTLEWAVLTLPALWLCAIYGSDALAAGLGAVWLAGRIWYAIGYARAAELRSKGFVVGALAFAGMGLASAWGVGAQILAALR
jgi:glutathione S-transferase